MRTILFTGLGVALFATAAMAQSVPPSNVAMPPAVATGSGESNTTAAPVAGKNSFTEAQASARLEQHGYTHLADLRLDGNSIWRGLAVKDGKSVAVSLDFQGNIVSR